MSKYSIPTNRFIANLGRSTTYRWEEPMTNKDYRLIMIDFMTECELEFSDLQFMNLSPVILTKWLEENNKPYYWANIIQSMIKCKRKNGISKLHHLCTVLFPEYPWRVYLFPYQSWKVKQNRTDMMNDLCNFTGITSHEEFYDVPTYTFFNDFAYEVMRKKSESYTRGKNKISMANIVIRADWGPWYELVMEYWDDKVATGYNNGEPIVWEKYRLLALNMSKEENLELAKLWWKLTKERAGINTAEDLYELQTTDLLKYPGGMKFVHKFFREKNDNNCNGLVSFLELMDEQIPYDWFKLHYIRKVKYWQSDKYCREYFFKLLNHYELGEPKNLTLVTWEMIIDYHGFTFCKMNGEQGVARRIIELFPEWNLEHRDFIYNSRSERFGVLVFQNWFGYENITDQFKLPIKWSNGNQMRVDCLIKHLNILTEFNGLSHYRVSFFNKRYKHRPNHLELAAKRFARQEECDIEKRLSAEGLGYRYLILPWTKHDPTLPKWNKTFDKKTKKSCGVSFIKLCELQGITREEIEGARYGRR